MDELVTLGRYLATPLSVVFAFGVAGAVLLVARRKRAAATCAALALLLLWIASTPAMARLLMRELEMRHPAMAPAATPAADAIVILGGAVAGAFPPERPTYQMATSAGRVWHAAALYRAGKARWVIVAAGNRGQESQAQPEAQAIADMLQTLGVPASAIRLEEKSTNTRENAAYSLPLVREVGARAVLLVTSAAHMDRALATFERAWRGQGIRVVPAGTDYRSAGPAGGLELWFPTAAALENVTSALKEFAGQAGLFMIGL